jgi:hypothetical protein
VRALVSVAAGVPLAALFVLPGSVAGFREGLPPVFANNIDAFLPAFCTWVASIALAAGLTRCGAELRDASDATQRRSARFAAALGVGLGAAIYALVAWGLPLASRFGAYPHGVPAARMFYLRPFLLTTPELWRVQAAFVGAGGFSGGIALTQELRLWLAMSVTVIALVGAAAMLLPVRAGRVTRTAVVQFVAFWFLMLALAMTFGPVARVQPSRHVFTISWIVLGVAGIASGWWLHRRTRERSAPDRPEDVRT